MADLAADGRARIWQDARRGGMGGGLAEQDGELRIALVAATMAEGRGVMIEGQSGLLSIASAHLRPRFEPSLRRLVWPGGAQAFLYSAAEPEALRGPEHHFAWADEIAKWPQGGGGHHDLLIRRRDWPCPVTCPTWSMSTRSSARTWSDVKPPSFGCGRSTRWR